MRWEKYEGVSKKENEKIWEKFIRVGGVVGGGYVKDAGQWENGMGGGECREHIEKGRVRGRRITRKRWREGEMKKKQSEATKRKRGSVQCQEQHSRERWEKKALNYTIKMC